MSRWIWAYWLSPFTWNMQAMAINEMTTPPWGPSGKEALESFGFYTHRLAMLHLLRVLPMLQSQVLSLAAVAAMQMAAQSRQLLCFTCARFSELESG